MMVASCPTMTSTVLAVKTNTSPCPRTENLKTKADLSTSEEAGTMARMAVVLSIQLTCQAAVPEIRVESSKATIIVEAWLTVMKYTEKIMRMIQSLKWKKRSSAIPKRDWEAARKLPLATEDQEAEQERMIS